MNWAAFLIYALTTAITPGPNNALSMENGSRRGFIKALPFNLGIWLGFSVVAMVSAVFLDLLSGILPLIKIPLLILGSAYLLFLARGTLYRTDKEVSHQENLGFLHGVALQFINAKEYIYCMVSFQMFILPHFHGKTATLLLFALLLALIGFSCTLLWSAFGSAFRALFSKHAKAVNTMMAALLIYCALALLF